MAARKSGDITDRIRELTRPDPQLVIRDLSRLANLAEDSLVPFVDTKTTASIAKQAISVIKELLDQTTALEDK